MSLDISILYRGALSSCNYDCPYCPFAKHWESAEELTADRQGLSRFQKWLVSRENDRFALYFTPWGEALVRQWYRDAIVQLSHYSHICKIAVQTNLSCNLDWLQEVAIEKIGLWCTYHPGQTTRPAFLHQCRRLSDLGVSYSVGCVGIRDHLEEIEYLRQELPETTYLWVNGYKSESDYYDEALLSALEHIDPLFPLNNTTHESYGHFCRTGLNVFAVDDLGDIRRCHFVDQVIGNLYESEIEHFCSEIRCPNKTCDCHIGYVHLDYLKLDRVFGNGILERVPNSWPKSNAKYGNIDFLN